ncbi:MAG: FAD-dependent oxidoreductase [Firmicutes bacterium HGW-Firmicutes-4]|jgi:prolycopene isomerase|nr:MAG: FAD-dependent oxidoreductase [Firmicutes bacterium HGW-Firmicutes-4]
MEFDAIIIGGGLSGLTAGSLLAKSGLKVAVIEKSYNPGGSCGVFKRNGATFDIGAAMLFGFGEAGFNAHRFVFNCLEQPIEVVKHDLLYCMHFKGHVIRFGADIDDFAAQLGTVFPSEQANVRRFYRDLEKMYRDVMVANPNYTTPDETETRGALKSLIKHPLSYARFLGYLNKSARSLLENYFSDPEIFKFFDKITSTYCYATLEEAPAVLAAVMFVDNHVGGSYYPAGSTIFLPGKLEQVIEENRGTMVLETEVTGILFEHNRPVGVELSSGEKIFGRDLIYSGTVWNLYGKLIDRPNLNLARARWAARQVPTYPSVVLYAQVDKVVIPPDTQPVEMLVGNPDRLDESEVTVYISSIDDHTLCDENSHVVLAIGPSFENWQQGEAADYLARKELEQARLIGVLENRFPGFGEAIRYAELATPRTIERYTNKNGGAVAGPKQMLGQHMFKRLHTRTEWDNLFCCGESTVMGTGTPTVTTSGISAANAVLKKRGLRPYVYQPERTNMVKILDKPVTAEKLYADVPADIRSLMQKASRCEYCEHPYCSIGMQAQGRNLDIRGIMRRVAVGNLVGARKRLAAYCEEHQIKIETAPLDLNACETRCIQNTRNGQPVEIQAVIAGLLG